MNSLSLDQASKIGLVPTHEYTIMKLVYLNGELVVKMRNPWGNTEWQGDWSFLSKKWVGNLKL